MASVNRVMLLGNVGRDTELKTTPNGMMVANFSLATSEKRKNKQTGESVEETQWHRVICFDRIAEIAAEYVKKGNSVFIEGSIRHGEYKDKDGNKRLTTDILCTQLKLMSDGKKPELSIYKDKARSPSKAIDDDIPF